MLNLRSYAIVGILLASGLPLAAQLDPEDAQVISYFPQLADGGAASQQWTTALTFVNPHGWITASAMAWFYGNDGKPLALDFGSGPVSTFEFTVPPQGMVSYKTTGLSPVTQVGWAMVVSSLPLEGVVQFSYSVNGVPQQGVSSQSTAASTEFRSPATTATGIAVANTYSDISMTIGVSAIDALGNPAGKSSVTIPAYGHQSFTLGQMIPALASSFRGTVVLDAGDTFVAWALSGDSGVLSSYPPAGLNWPVSQFERILKVWFKVINEAGDLGLNPLPNLVIGYATSPMNAYADITNNAVHVSMNLAELISDSESELAFVMGHEVGHFFQRQLGGQEFVPADAEQDADQFGVYLSLGAGYDPYGGAGALGKLAMASAQTGVVAPNFDNLAVDPHGSFSGRLSLLLANMQAVCSPPDMQPLCSMYKDLYHPHLPVAAPLMVPSRAAWLRSRHGSVAQPVQPSMPPKESH